MSYDDKEDSTVFGYRCKLTTAQANEAHEWCLRHPLVIAWRRTNSVVEWMERNLSPSDPKALGRLAEASEMVANVELKQFVAAKAWVRNLEIPEGC